MRINKEYKVSDKPLIYIYDIAELSIHDGPGMRTVVYFQGCNAQCDWCHSPQSQPYSSPLLFNSILCTKCRLCSGICKNKVHTFTKGIHLIKRSNCNKCGYCVTTCPNSIDGVGGSALHFPTTKTSVSTLFEQIKPYLKLTKQGGGITLSGGEALLQTDAAKELLLLCKKAGFHTAVETSGLLPMKIYQSVAPIVDLWLFGMRVITGASHSRHDDSIRHTLKELVNSGAKILPRIPMVPSFFDRKDVLESIISILNENKIDIVCLSKWNINYNINYIKSGIDLKMQQPTHEDIIRCENIIIDSFNNAKFKMYENEF